MSSRGEDTKGDTSVFFLEKMQRVCIEWVEIYNRSELKAVFGYIVEVFGDM